MSMIKGGVDSILAGKPEDYVTTVSFILPYQPADIKAGDYSIEDRGHQINIHLKVLENSHDDPIMKHGKDWDFGVSGTGVPSLPFEVFSDNKGEYANRCFFNRRLN